MPEVAYSAVAIFAFVAAWIALSESRLFRPGYIPTPPSLAAALLDLIRNGYQGHPLWQHVGISMMRTGVGFAIGASLGIPLGLWAGYSRIAGAMVTPIMAFIRPIPPIAFIPMAVLYFGLGETGKIVLIAFVAFNYAQTNAQSGASNVPRVYLRVARSMRLSPLQTFSYVVAPAALPQVFTGLRVALALSWAVVVAAELVGAQLGLGYLISDAALLLRIPTVFVGIALIGAIGLALNGILNAVEFRVVHGSGRR